jgi:hypothetical protein
MLQLGNLFQELLLNVFGHSFSVAVSIDSEGRGGKPGLGIHFG